MGFQPQMIMIDVTIEIPFYLCLNKNRSHYKTRIRRRKTVAAQVDIAYTLRQKVLPHEWDPDKNIAVTIFVRHNRMGTDAHNFQAMILDALEQGSGVNDSKMDPVTISGRKVVDDEEPGFVIQMVQE